MMALVFNRVLVCLPLLLTEVIGVEIRSILEVAHRTRPRLVLGTSVTRTTQCPREP